MDPFSSVSAAHDVGENVRRQLQQSHPEVAEVFIHVGIYIVSLTFLRSKIVHDRTTLDVYVFL